MSLPQVTQVTVGHDLKESVIVALQPLGGIAAFVQPGERVLLKPNFNTSDPFPASSASDFIAAVADLVHEAGAGAVALGESCTYFLKTSAVMSQCGVANMAAERPWLQLINFDEDKWDKRDIANGRYLKSVSLPHSLQNFDRVIILPCLKTHVYAQYTGALKLAVGLMKPSERLSLHMHRLQDKIAELNLAYRPDLVIMDARKCFIAGGPAGGIIREPKLVLASASRVAVDLAGVKIIRGFAGNALANVEPENLPQISRAIEMGVV